MSFFFFVPFLFCHIRILVLLVLVLYSCLKGNGNIFDRWREGGGVGKGKGFLRDFLFVFLHCTQYLKINLLKKKRKNLLR